MIKDKFKKIVKKEEVKAVPLFDPRRYNFRDWRDIVSQNDFDKTDRLDYQSVHEKQLELFNKIQDDIYYQQTIRPTIDLKRRFELVSSKIHEKA